MKIISNFRDYYDSILLYGTDPKLLYYRNTDEIKFNLLDIYEKNKINVPHIFKFDNDFPYNRGVDYFNKKINIATNYFYIFFCGKLYIGIYTTLTDLEKFNCSCYDDYVFNFIHYSVESLSKWIINKLGNEIKNNKEYIKYIKDITNELTYLYSNIKISNNLFIKFNTPIFLIDKFAWEDIIINPQLKSYDFMKVKNPFEAFQEISEYIGNIFGVPGNKIININDRSKIIKHGFDKWSFRKMKK